MERDPQRVKDIKKSGINELKDSIKTNVAHSKPRRL
jgi:hypothetical protein